MMKMVSALTAISIGVIFVQLDFALRVCPSHVGCSNMKIRHGNNGDNSDSEKAHSVMKWFSRIY
jgi:hypothetical protein